MHRTISSFCYNVKFLSKPLYVFPWCCIEMQHITWLIPCVEQMSDVQMCMLLLEIRVVGEVSRLLYYCLCTHGWFCMYTCMYGDRLNIFPCYVLVIVCPCQYSSTVRERHNSKSMMIRWFFPLWQICLYQTLRSCITCILVTDIKDQSVITYEKILILIWLYMVMGSWHWAILIPISSL